MVRGGVAVEACRTTNHARILRLYPGIWCCLFYSWYVDLRYAVVGNRCVSYVADARVFSQVFFIFYLLVQTGTIEGEDQNLMDKIEASFSYAALLWGTMAAAIVTLLFYLFQPVRDGEIVMPNLSVLREMFSFTVSKSKAKEEEVTTKARFLMSVGESIEAFLYGMGRIFPALIVLTLAWASGAVMVAVGADRLFARWIVGGISPEALPTLSFVISFFMALATGTSWGTMTILFPLILVPTYDASGGDETIFYAVTAGVLSGSVAGDHVSPISDTTVLSALACDCNLMAHVSTQAPYVLVIVAISIFLGTIPIGYDAWPNIVGILLGAVVTVVFVYGLCVPVLCPTGRFDVFTELFLRWGRRGSEDGEESGLVQLKQNTARSYNGETVGEEEQPIKEIGSPEVYEKAEKPTEEYVADVVDETEQDETQVDYTHKDYA